ncbi:MAG: hypothetical protein ACRDN9_17360 [Streptosporangiaceae bacterium]
MTTQTLPKERPTGRAAISARTLRKDRWWIEPSIYGGLLFVITGYLLYVTFSGVDYYWEPYLSPFYSPCITANCFDHAGGVFQQLPSIAPAPPSLLIIAFPAAFRVTCYYYRKAYYRSFLFAPPACAVQEPHKRYFGETRIPLIIQNSHRYWWYFAMIFAGILSYEAVLSFRDHSGAWGHAGFGTLMLVVNALLLWGYTLSCHSCRHIMGGRLNHFNRHPIRYRFWSWVSTQNGYHMQWAWASLVWITLTDVYIRLVASGTIADVRFF